MNRTQDERRAARQRRLDEMTADELRAKAAEYQREAAESFARCDTDGFLSQWSSGLHERLMRRMAELRDNGDVAEFPALFDLTTGARVPAVLVYPGENSPWYAKPYWAVCDPATGKFTGRFVTAFPKRETTMANKGFREGTETAPARAKIAGRGKGLSGTCWVEVYRTDGGYPGRPDRRGM